MKLFKFPSKLLSVVKSAPQLLNEVPINVITNIFQKEIDDGLLGNIPANFILKISKEIPGSVLSNFTTSIVRRLPSEVIIKIVNSEAVEKFFLKSSDNLENPKLDISQAEIAP